MNGDDRKNGRGQGKTLLPEFLPAPGAGMGSGAALPSPPERVAARARVLLQRFRGLGTAAGAAVLSLNCTGSGYMVVDPLPPPPVACTMEPTPFASINASGVYASGSITPPPVILVLQTSGYPPSNFVGYAIDAVRVTGGTLLSTQDMSSLGVGGGTRFHITIVPATSTPTDILVDVDLTCGASAGTKHYSIAYRVPTSPTESAVVTERTPVDAGVQLDASAD